MRLSVSTQIMMWLAIAALFPAVLWPPSGAYRLAIEWAVCAGTAAAILQAFREKHHFLVYAFLLVGVVFNPVLPVPFSSGAFVWLAIACTAAFLAALAALGQPVFHYSSDNLGPTRLNPLSQLMTVAGHRPVLKVRESCQMMNARILAIAISSAALSAAVLCVLES
jgi:hypothetical protein